MMVVPSTRWWRLWQPFAGRRLAVSSLIVLAVFVFVGVFTPWLTPYEPLQKHNQDDGRLMRLLTLTGDFWFGTTLYARDVFSQMVIGTRSALIVGVITAAAMTFIGLNVGLVAENCDRVAIMYAGHFVEQADTRTLFGAPVHPYTLGLENAFPSTARPKQEALISITGAPPVLLETPHGCRFAPRCPFASARCRDEDP